MSNFSRIIFFLLLIMFMPIKVYATEPEALMDSFINYDKQYKELNKTRIKYELIGVYEITAYCPCVSCCGKSNGKTASGKIAKPNHTIAADINHFSFNDEVYIDGTTYVVEDTGGAIRGNRIDMFFGSHSEALSYGRKYEKLYKEYREDYILKEIPFYEWMMITDDISKDKTIDVVKYNNGTVEYRNQSGNVLAYRNRIIDNTFNNYVDKTVYIEWLKGRR